jgi:carbamoyltransferase
MRTEMDVLILGNYILDKSNQPKFEEKSDWKTEYELD